MSLEDRLKHLPDPDPGDVDGAMRSSIGRGRRLRVGRRIGGGVTAGVLAVVAVVVWSSGGDERVQIDTVDARVTTSVSDPRPATTSPTTTARVRPTAPSTTTDQPYIPRESDVNTDIPMFFEGPSVNAFVTNLAGSCTVAAAFPLEDDAYTEPETDALHRVVGLTFGGEFGVDPELFADARWGKWLPSLRFGAGGGHVNSVSLEDGRLTVDVESDWVELSDWYAGLVDLDPRVAANWFGSMAPCWVDDLIGVRLAHGVLSVLQLPGVESVRVLVEGEPDARAGSGRFLTAADVLGAGGHLVLTDPAMVSLHYDEPWTLAGLSDEGGPISWSLHCYAYVGCPADDLVASGTVQPQRGADGLWTFEQPMIPIDPCQGPSATVQLEQQRADGSMLSIVSQVFFTDAASWAAEYCPGGRAPTP